MAAALSPEDAERIAALEERVKAAEEAAAFIRKYGAGLTEEQIRFYKDIEAREAENRRKNAESARRSREYRKRKEAAIQSITLDLIRADMIRVYINRARVMPGDGLTFTCPDCGTPIPSAAGYAVDLAERVIGNSSPVAVLEKGAVPFVQEQLFELIQHDRLPALSRTLPCPSCRAGIFFAAGALPI